MTSLQRASVYGQPAPDDIHEKRCMASVQKSRTLQGPWPAVHFTMPKISRVFGFIVPLRLADDCESFQSPRRGLGML